MNGIGAIFRKLLEGPVGIKSERDPSTADLLRFTKQIPRSG